MAKNGRGGRRRRRHCPPDRQGIFPESLLEVARQYVYGAAGPFPASLIDVGFNPGGGEGGRVDIPALASVVRMTHCVCPGNPFFVGRAMQLGGRSWPNTDVLSSPPPTHLSGHLAS
jgi:hypothetical protein